MKNKLPRIKTNKRICIVCEGDEEYYYLKKLKQIKLFNKKLTIDLLNANGIDKVFNVYSNAYQRDNYDLVVIFCDTDNDPFERYKKIKEDVKNFHDLKKVSDVSNLIYYGNPCSMQVILSHFQKVTLHSRLKTINANKIKELTGVADYRATKHQIDCIMKKITFENIKTMKENLKDICKKDTITPSTNFTDLILNLEDVDSTWIDKVNKIL